MQLNYQYAHHSHEESETHKIENAQDALIAFDNFDWAAEVEKANELQKASPTITLILGSNEHMIWVSGYGSRDDYSFVSNCNFPGEVSGFLGFGKKMGTVDLDANNFSKEQARAAIELFINGSGNELRSLYKNA